MKRIVVSCILLAAVVVTAPLCYAVDGRDITDATPEVDLSAAFKLFGGWHFILGAEDLAGSDIGFNFGLRTEVGQ